MKEKPLPPIPSDIQDKFKLFAEEQVDIPEEFLGVLSESFWDLIES